MIISIVYGSVFGAVGLGLHAKCMFQNYSIESQKNKLALFAKENPKEAAKVTLLIKDEIKKEMISIERESQTLSDYSKNFTWIERRKETIKVWEEVLALLTPKL